MAFKDHGIHSCEEYVLEGSDSFNTLWEEEEAQLIIREKKMGATEDQALTIQRRSLKR